LNRTRIALVVSACIVAIVAYVTFKPAPHAPMDKKAESIRVVSSPVQITIEPGGKLNVPFPDAMEQEPDPEVARLVSNWNHAGPPSADDPRKTILSMGSDAVPSLIIILKQAANKEPVIIEQPGGTTDISVGDQRAALIALADIGDRRALPAISALVKYDNEQWRFRGALETILLHGSYDELLRDAESDDPNIARIAQQLVDNKPPPGML